VAKVLVIGSGGREQALAWKLAESTQVEQVYVAPGNGGSRGKVKNAEINFDDAASLADFAKTTAIDLTMVGQEAASAAGVVDVFKASGLKIFGPTKAAVKIESSKAFSKTLMSQQAIPTADFKNFTDAQEAIAYAKSRPLPVVIKADGLATGKGVIIAENAQQIEAAVNDIMIKRIFGEAGAQLVVEDFLLGQEVSVHALCDGKTSIIFPPSQDHKQIFDGDKGPNTGGMGVVAPIDWVSSELLNQVNQTVVQPALKGLIKHQAPFTGCLYPGLMINGQDIKVLEFNARFGDPEAEVYMRLIDSDLYEALRAAADGQLKPSHIKWRQGYAVSVVLASGGYPGEYKKGLPISGMDRAEALEGIVIFHAGTAIKDGQIVTAGGRVLNVTATGQTLDEALSRAYRAVELINFEGMHYRRDIGRRP